MQDERAAGQRPAAPERPADRVGESSDGDGVRGAPVRQVVATDRALALIGELAARHGPLMFHQSGGCCDGSAPMCYPHGEFVLGDEDVLLGDIGGMPFYIGASQFEYWQHTQLVIDVVAGRGGMFSLEGPTGRRFLTRSRLYDDDEWAALRAAGRVTD